jgi:chromosome segregation ATPase
MNVNDAPGGIDPAKFLEYIVNQFPGDLRQMVEVRDELAVRQGAISAAQLALADRDAAAGELASARAEALVILNDAKDDAAKVKAKKAALDAREASLDSREKMISDELTQRDIDVQTREDRVAAAEANVAQLEAKNIKLRSDLEDQASALEARIRAFQEKVASLTA